MSDLAALRITREPESEHRRRGPYGLIALGLVVIAASGLTGYVAYEKTIGRPLDVKTVTVIVRQAGQPSIVLTGSGYIVTRHKYIVVGTKILGQIVEEPIEEGQRVKRGDLLARIDDRDYRAQLGQAVADRDLAQADLTLAQAKVMRRRELFATHSISAEELDESENDVIVAQATLRRDIAAIDFATFQVDQCVIVSPIDGIVLQKYRELGATLNYGGQATPSTGATDIAQLADTRDMRAEVDINESDIARVSLGMAAAVVPDAYPHAHYDATLVKIYPEADRQKATVKVEVHLLRPDLAIIKPELSVKVNFLDGRQTTAQPSIVVPEKAVLRAGDGAHVWTVQRGVAHRAAVVLGPETESGIEIRRGLRDGDVIILDSVATLHDGMPVRSQ